jgi:hypothetical protein
MFLFLLCLLCRATAPPPAAIATPPEADHCSSAAPRVVPELTAVPPPLVTPDLHITPSKVRPSSWNLPSRFPLAAGDRRRRNLTSISRLLCPDEQGPNCDALNLSEGLAARFQSLPSFQNQ